MGVRILEGTGEGDSQGAVLYDSVSGYAFGPVFENRDEAEAFLFYCEPSDPRSYATAELESVAAKFLETR